MNRRWKSVLAVVAAIIAYQSFERIKNRGMATQLLGAGTATGREALQALYEIARSERSFEISQLVQRNNFVMIFQGVLFAGYIQASSNSILPARVAFTVCLVGLFTAIGQYLMAAGAKFWQERWEIEVEQIESKLSEMLTQDQQRSQWFPLFTRSITEVEQTIRQRMAGRIFGGTVAARWSPSRLPIFVAFVFLLAWGSLALAHIEMKEGRAIKLVPIKSAA